MSRRPAKSAVGESAVGAALRCAFGETGARWPGPHHCAACAAAVEAAITYMLEARARGEYDAAGYTPNERKAQQRKQKAPTA